MIMYDFSQNVTLKQNVLHFSKTLRKNKLEYIILINSKKIIFLNNGYVIVIKYIK